MYMCSYMYVRRHTFSISHGPSCEAEGLRTVNSPTRTSPREMLRLCTKNPRNVLFSLLGSSRRTAGKMLHFLAVSLHV